MQSLLSKVKGRAQTHVERVPELVRQATRHNHELNDIKLQGLYSQLSLCGSREEYAALLSALWKRLQKDDHRDHVSKTLMLLLHLLKHLGPPQARRQLESDVRKMWLGVLEKLKDFKTDKGGKKDAEVRRAAEQVLSYLNISATVAAAASGGSAVTANPTVPGGNGNGAVSSDSDSDSEDDQGGTQQTESKTGAHSAASTPASRCNVRQQKQLPPAASSAQNIAAATDWDDFDNAFSGDDNASGPQASTASTPQKMRPPVASASAPHLRAKLGVYPSMPNLQAAPPTVGSGLDLLHNKQHASTEQTERLRVERNRLRQQTEEMKEKEMELKARLGNQEATLRQLRAELSKERQERRADQARWQAQQERLAQQQSEQAEAIREAKNLLAQREQEHQQALAAAAARRGGGHSSDDETRGDVTRLREEVQTLSAELEQMRASKEEVESNGRRLAQKQTEVESDNAALRKACTQLRQEMATASSSASSAQEEAGDLRSQLTTCQDELKVTKKELTETKQLLKEAKQALEETDASWREKYEAKENELTSGARAEKQQEVDAIRKEMSEELQRKSAEWSQVQTMQQKTIDELMGSLNDMQSALEEARAARAEKMVAEKALTDLKEVVKQLQNRANRDAAALEEERAAKQSAEYDLKECKEELQRKTQSLTNALEALTHMNSNSSAPGE